MTEATGRPVTQSNLRLRPPAQGIRSGRGPDGRRIVRVTPERDVGGQRMGRSSLVVRARCRQAHGGLDKASASGGRDSAMQYYASYLRWLYRGGHPNVFARLQNRGSAIAFAAGIVPNRAGTLQIRGRISGRVISFPVVIADFAGERYLVSMLGENANWVRNLKAAGGHAVLRHGRREDVSLEEVEPSARAPVLRRYLQVAPGARPHIPVDRKAPLPEFARVAPDYPVFRIRTGAA